MNNLSRRRFIALGGAGLAAVPLSSILNSAIAAELPMVDPESAQAGALQYAAASTTAGQNCANCVLYQGDAEAAGGACALFPGSQVGKEAWCAAWAAKP